MNFRVAGCAGSSWEVPHNRQARLFNLASIDGRASSRSVSHVSECEPRGAGNAEVIRFSASSIFKARAARNFCHAFSGWAASKFGPIATPSISFRLSGQPRTERSLSL